MNAYDSSEKSSLKSPLNSYRQVDGKSCTCSAGNVDDMVRRIVVGRSLRNSVGNACTYVYPVLYVPSSLSVIFDSIIGNAM